MTLDDVAARYNCSFPDEFRRLHPEVLRSPCFTVQRYLTPLSPSEMVAAKEGVLLPDLVPVFGTAFGDAICYRMPAPSTPRHEQYVLFCHEGGGCASLGKSFRGVLAFVAWLLETTGVDPFGAPPVGDLRLGARELLKTLPILDAENLAFLVDEQMLEEPYFGYSAGVGTPILTDLLPEGVAVPLALCKQAEEHWERGDMDAARASWQAAVREDPECGAGHWGLGAYHACGGDVEKACRHYTALVEGHWSSGFPETLTDAQCWQASPARASRYLRQNGATYAQISQHGEISSLVLHGRFDDSASWAAALERSLAEQQYAGAKIIALNGLCPKPWHDLGKIAECGSALKIVAEADGVGNRAVELD